MKPKKYIYRKKVNVVKEQRSNKVIFFFRLFVFVCTPQRRLHG